MLRAALTLIALSCPSLRADDEKVFSGPQPGEKLTAFKVLAVHGPQAGKEVEMIGELKGAPTVLLFVHEWTRPMLQLARGVDAFGAKWAADGLATHFVMLSADKAKAEEYLTKAKGSLNLKSPSSVSLDGLEGPGNYGLNRKMTCTILIAKDNKVTANFAIIQPNETDVPKVLAEVAKLLGKTAPTAEDVRVAVGGPGVRVVPPDGQEPDPELTKLMRAMIQQTNDDSKVKETAEAMLKWAGDNPRKKAQLVEYCKKVIKLGYGNEIAQKALKRIAGE
jgi:hypothetical protein